MARLALLDGPAEDGQPMEVIGGRRRGMPAPRVLGHGLETVPARSRVAIAAASGFRGPGASPFAGDPSRRRHPRCARQLGGVGVPQVRGAAL